MSESKPGYLIGSTRRVVHLWFAEPHRDDADAVKSMCGKWRKGDDVDYNVGTLRWCGRCAQYKRPAQVRHTNEEK